MLLFLPDKDMEGLPGWGISSMTGPPPRQHKHERRYTPSTHIFILTTRIWRYDYDGQMIFEHLVGLKVPDICLVGEEKILKKPHPGNLSRLGIEPGPAEWQVRMLPPASQRWMKKGINIRNNQHVLEVKERLGKEISGKCLRETSNLIPLKSR